MLDSVLVLGDSTGMEELDTLDILMDLDIEDAIEDAIEITSAVRLRDFNIF